MKASEVSKSFTKADEISLLEKLIQGNGYFAELFKNDEQQMCQNIRNDFPIEFQTQFGKHKADSDFFQNQVRNLETSVKMSDESTAHYSEKLVRLNTLYFDLLKEIVSSNSVGVSTSTVGFYSWEEVMKVKLKLGVELSPEERTMLSERL